MRTATTNGDMNAGSAGISTPPAPTRPQAVATSEGGASRTQPVEGIMLARIRPGGAEEGTQLARSSYGQ